MDGRRILDFDSLDQVMPEVDRLLRGHATSGDWSLGQILHHLASSIRLSLDQEPGSAIQTPGPELERVFEVRRRRFFRAGRFPEGALIPYLEMNPPPDADERASAESLRSALRHLEEFDGSFPAHPMLGAMTKAEWGEFHRLHCAHHLGFARPTEPDPDRIDPEHVSSVP